MYVVVITDETNHFRLRSAYGNFESVEEIQLWLDSGNKFNNSSYSVEILHLNSLNN